MHSFSVMSAWSNRVARSLDDALPPGLLSRDVAALTLVAHHRDVGADWLRERIGLTQSGTVRTIDRLVGAGLLVRSGRRGHHVVVTVTSAGVAALSQWQHDRSVALERILDRLDTSSRAELLRLMSLALEGEERDRIEADTLCRTCDWGACTPCPVDRSVVGDHGTS